MLAEMRVRVLRQTVRGDDQVWLLDAKTSTVWDQKGLPSNDQHADDNRYGTAG